MIFTDKIVTLSYGTFSCSLQGFDDKFEILKPIAEYYRDLTIEAQQSGKGLSAPNADDLARIVGEIIAQPVTGYEAQGVIVLSPDAAGDVAESVGDDIEKTEEKPEQEVVDAAPEEGDETLLDELGGSRPLSEETVAAISDILTAQEEAASDGPDPDADPAEGGNIFGDDPAGDAASEVKEMADKPDQKQAGPESDAADAGDSNEAGPAAADAGDSDADAGEPAEEAPRPVVRPSRIGRVIKMKRGDFDAAIRDGVIEEDPGSTEDAVAGRDMKASKRGLSDESEADLQRKLAEVDKAAGKSGSAIKPTKPKASVRRSGVDRLQSSERRSDLERIFEEADSKLGKPDTSERRNALHHLRAAVAATRAEKSAGHELHRHTDETPYRTDLAEAVDASAGANKKSRSRRKNTSVLPPLKLASDQRIDPDKS